MAVTWHCGTNETMAVSRAPLCVPRGRSIASPESGLLLLSCP
jgi:hypothetical protein